MGIFQSMQDEVDDRDKRDGISLAEMLDLEPLQRRLVKQITRKGELGIEAAAKLVELSPEETREILDSMVKKSYLDRVERDGEWYYQVRLARRRRSRTLPPGIWSALDSRTKEE
jgi:predicted transcriptional regulator of viral defense system